MGMPTTTNPTPVIDRFVEDPNDWSSPINRHLAHAAVHLRAAGVPDADIYAVLRAAP